MLYSSYVPQSRRSWSASSACMRGVKAVGETHLASGIDDLRGELLAFVLDDLAEGVFNCRVVALDKVAVDELDRKRGLACVITSVLQSQLQACDSQRPARQLTATGRVGGKKRKRKIGND